MKTQFIAIDSQRSTAPKVAIFFLTISCLAANGAAAKEQGSDTNHVEILTAEYSVIIEKLTDVVRAEIEQKNIPAFSISLVDDGKIVWADGFGHQDAQKTTPATADTIYRVGSISKLFTDLTIMQLVDQGILSLDEPVTNWLPEFQPKNPYKVELTLKQLMSHRSGLVREAPVGSYFDPSEPTVTETVASLNNTTIIYEPETRIKYSNAAITVAGAVIEKLLPGPYSKSIEHSLLGPLKMTNSSFVRTPRINSNLATGWMWTWDGRRFEAPLFSLGIAPAGNMYSSVTDLAKFAISLCEEGNTQAAQIVSKRSLNEMTTPVRDQNDRPLGFGLGFHVQDLDGHKKIGHGGAVYGFSSQLEILPKEKLAVAAVSALDGSNGTVQRIADYALRLLLAKRENQPLPAYRSTVEIPADRAITMVGTYTNGNKLTRITELDGKVFMLRGSLRHELRAAADDGTIVTDDVSGFGIQVNLNNDLNLVIDKTIFTRLPDTPPPPAPTEWKGLIGEYGWDHNTLYILEDQGQLYALIEWFYYYPLTPVNNDTFAFPDYGLYHGETLTFNRNDTGHATQVVAAEVKFMRREVGTRDGETFRIIPIKPINELRTAALSDTPPPEPGDYRASDLVELTSLDPTIKLDIRYATTNNFTGAVFYRQPKAYMQRPAAEAVVAAHRQLKNKGLGLLIHDAYRPWHVTKMFWDATPDNLKTFVANPATGSRHNRGCAVDLTLYDLMTGEPIQMVAGYDEFSPRSFPEYPGGTSNQRWYRHLLRHTMESAGFTIYEFEWWHFDFHEWEKYRIGNQTFEQLP